MQVQLFFRCKQLINQQHICGNKWGLNKICSMYYVVVSFDYILIRNCVTRCFSRIFPVFRFAAPQLLMFISAKIALFKAEKCATNCINQCIFAQKMGYSISVKEIQLQKMYPVVTDKYTKLWWCISSLLSVSCMKILS